MLTSAQLKKVTTEARPIIERMMEDADRLAGLRDVVSAAGGDWGQLKALIKAQIKDEDDEAGEGKHVRKILDRADYATAYADMLGLAKMNEKNFFAEDRDPETGEITDPAVPPAADDGPDPAITAPVSNPPAAGADHITRSEAGVLPDPSRASAAASPAGAEADTDRHLISDAKQRKDNPAPASDGSERSGLAVTNPAKVTPLHTGKVNSKGMPRHDDCLDVECCAGTWRQACHTCRKAAAERIAVEPGGVAIEHQGSVA